MQVTIEQHLYATKKTFGPGMDFCLAPYDIREWSAKDRGGRVHIKTIQTTVDVPDNFDPTADMVKDLEQQKAEARAAFQARVTELDRQIQSLLAITNEA